MHFFFQATKHQIPHSFQTNGEKEESTATVLPNLSAVVTCAFVFIFDFGSFTLSCMWHSKLCTDLNSAPFFSAGWIRFKVRVVCHQQQPLLLLLVVYLHEPAEVKFVSCCSHWWLVLRCLFTGMRKNRRYCLPFLWKGGEGRKKKHITAGAVWNVKMEISSATTDLPAND